MARAAAGSDDAAAPASSVTSAFADTAVAAIAAARVVALANAAALPFSSSTPPSATATDARASILLESAGSAHAPSAFPPVPPPPPPPSPLPFPPFRSSRPELLFPLAPAVPETRESKKKVRSDPRSTPRSAAIQGIRTQAKAAGGKACVWGAGVWGAWGVRARERRDRGGARNAGGLGEKWGKTAWQQLKTWGFSLLSLFPPPGTAKKKNAEEQRKGLRKRAEGAMGRARGRERKGRGARGEGEVSRGRAVARRLCKLQILRDDDG